MMPSLIFWLPFAGVDRRIAWLRGTLLVACFLGMIASAPVWLSTRPFPLLPITSGFPILPTSWDICLLATILLALLLAGWCYRTAVIYFLSASLFAFCQDQNRGQPWFYMYWVMLLLTLLPPPTALAACRWALSVVYLFGAGSKSATPGSFKSCRPGLSVRRRNGTCRLWSLTWGRRGGGGPPIIAVVGLHLGAVLLLGPSGHNYNWVVWPWNFAMIALVGVLFLTRNTKPKGTALDETRRPFAKGSPRENSDKPARVRTGATPAGPFLNETYGVIFRSRLALAGSIPFSLLPILSYFGRWDSYFSFALYSENSASVNLFVTKAFGDRLPPAMRVHVHPFP